MARIVSPPTNDAEMQARFVAEVVGARVTCSVCRTTWEVEAKDSFTPPEHSVWRGWVVFCPSCKMAAAKIGGIWATQVG